MKYANRDTWIISIDILLKSANRRSVNVPLEYQEKMLF